MVTQPPALRNRGPGRVVTSAGYVTSQDTVTWHPRAQTYAAISLPNGYRNWIQGGRASLSGGGPIRFPPSSPLGASVNPARRCGLTTHGRISDCRHGTARTRLGTQEGQSSMHHIAHGGPRVPGVQYVSGPEATQRRPVSHGTIRVRRGQSCQRHNPYHSPSSLTGTAAESPLQGPGTGQQRTVRPRTVLTRAAAGSPRGPRPRASD